MSLPELANANLPLVILAAAVFGGFLGWWLCQRRAAVGPLRARQEAAQADAERLEEEL